MSWSDVGPPEREVRDRSHNQQVMIPPKSLEIIKREFMSKFPQLGSVIERDTRKYIQLFFTNIYKQLHKSIDELSEITQNYYQVCSSDHSNHFFFF